MEKLRQQRRTSRLQHRDKVRRAVAIVEYLSLAAPQHHREATQFFNNIQHLYPRKKDLRKTPEFKAYRESKCGARTKKATKDNTNKQMMLNIELITKQTGVKTQTQKATNSGQDTPIEPEGEQVNLVFPDIPVDSEWDEINAAFRDIPGDIMNHMLKQINDDPDLKAILDEFDFADNDDDDLIDIDIDIDTESPLEKELNNIYS